MIDGISLHITYHYLDQTAETSLFGTSLSDFWRILEWIMMPATSSLSLLSLF